VFFLVLLQFTASLLFSPTCAYCQDVISGFISQSNSKCSLLPTVATNALLIHCKVPISSSFGKLNDNEIMRFLLNNQ